MRQPKRNELWKHMKEKHGVLLTLEEMDRIVKFAEEDRFDFVQEIREKINWYRVTNVLILLVFALVGWDLGLRAVVFLFLGYNIIHIIIINWQLRQWRKQKLNERRRRKKPY